MSLFDSLTGPKWQHGNPQVRKDAVEELEDQNVLLELATSDPDAAVQAAALARISDPDTLDRLIETLPQSLQQQARSQRLQQLLPSADRLETIADDTTLRRIIELSDDADLIARAIVRIGSDAVRLQIASSHPAAKVRLGAAQGIKEIALLSELAQRAKGHDKAIFRHCKTLVDEHQAQAQAAAETQQKIQRLCDKARELAATAGSPDYETNYRGLVAQWRVVRDSASPAQREQFQRDQASCAQRLVELADARAAEAQAEAELAAVREEFTAMLAELQQIDEAAAVPQNVTAIGQLSEQLDQIEKRWQAATKVTPAPADQTRTYRQTLELWRSMLQTLQRLDEQASRFEKIFAEAESADALDYQALKQRIDQTVQMTEALSWPEMHRAHLPARIAQLEHVLTELKKQFSLLEKNQPKYIARLNKQIGVLRSELEQEHSMEADRALARARGVLKSLAPKQRQQFEQELQPLAARLKEVDDWRNFAVEPKKKELCARMAALIGSEADVEVLAAKITLLQDEWKQLGALPRTLDQALWHEFKAAADEAWKPCKAAFEQQAAIRRENFDQRMRLVAQLTEYEQKMDWPQPAVEVPRPENPVPDWRLVQKTLDTARAAFGALRPVDQKSDRISRKAFRTICDRIYSHIKQEYERNIKQKEQLLALARALAGAEDLPQAIEQCKRLQREWKAVGITPQAVDRKLWKAFRGACDAVFKRLDERRAQDSAVLDAKVKQAESLRDQARTVLNSPDAKTLNRILSELKQQFREIELPAGVQKRLARDFQLIEGQARDMAVEIKRQRERASWTHLLESISACALRSMDRQDAIEVSQPAGELPAGIDAEGLKTYWQQGPSGDVEKQLRDACVALEIFGEIESPDKDKKARMEIQMQRLVTGMGRGKDQPEPTLEERINEFIALRPSIQWAERFCSALKKIKTLDLA